MPMLPDPAKAFLRCMLASTVFVSGAMAQVDTGTIAGRVLDPSGAVIPGAQITIFNMATSASATTRTSDNGQFVAPLLNVGIYSVTVEKPGFQRFVQSGIKVGVQTRLELAITVQLGVMTQEVHVTTDAPLLDTQSANVGQAVSERQLSDLPLNGRRYSDLVFLATGVNAVTLIMAARGEGVFSVDGNTSLQNNFVLDGLSTQSRNVRFSAK